jgi:UDP-N-acetylmuramate: L-alanyl-gamma-D-glutamyl-meso-diaminopimelate ligase
MRIHFIAIGGAIMHHLAMALQKQGHSVSGSDDKIADPAKTNLANAGILPDSIGFFEEKITSDIDAIILGMHARIDNIELLKAQRLGIKIYSFPHFIYEFAKEKKRVVIAGSHGKTSITSMVMHVLKKSWF